ncbi:hypothetical protein D187_009701 [Cystobacter fuscus DSM 2262]|uniref:Uncharacterized protein n=1 Tax=Cystobacter fuscus (strain ATCC 25194 / DSM 2262 / NBRC 100088 / M29) TaxID=1242864 RepID=S9NY65_CYSF2|nr:hypothetical protein D187_009701 [Cystobacter fuscus DSM 2262]
MAMGLWLLFDLEDVRVIMKSVRGLSHSHGEFDVCLAAFIESSR